MKVKTFTQMSERRWIFLLFALLFLWQLPYSQAADKLPNEKILLEEAFFHIGKEFGVFFNYDREIVADVTVEYEAGKYAEVKSALEAVFRQTSLRYQVFDQRFVAVYQDTREGIQSMKDMISHFQGIVDEKEKVSDRSVAIVPSLSRLSLKDVYQKRIVFSVSGTVTDEEGEPLIGVNIQVKGSNKGTSTDFDGKFTLEDIDENAVLVVSYVGYQTQEVIVAGKSTVAIVMKSDSQLLDEVVVVGYGTLREGDVSGSIVKLDQSRMNQGLVNSVDELIQGAASGVRVIQNTGEPGGGLSINIRGVGSISGGTSPLYVIDGLPIDNSVLISGTGNQIPSNGSPRNPLSSLNPNDIESIEILKDASATAIYGSRGANGVILISTKQGDIGDLQVNYGGTMGVQNVHNRLDLLNSNDYRDVVNALIDGGQGSESERVEKIFDGGIDWQDQIFQKNAPVQNHDLTFSWGSNDVSYLVSLNNMNQDGLVKNSKYNRYNGRINIKYNGSKLNFGVNSNISYIKDKFIPYGFDVNERSGVINAAKLYDPTISLYDENGELQRTQFANLDNPLTILNGTHMDANRYRYYGTVYGEYFIMNDLSARLNIGGDINNETKQSYIDRTTTTGNALGGIATVYDANYTNYLVEATVNYNKQFGDHRINAVLGSTAQKFIRLNHKCPLKSDLKTL